MRRVAGLVIAAGASTRMGPETNKLLEEIAGRALVCWPVDALLEAGAMPVVVVTGGDDAGIRDVLPDRALRFVHHEGWSQGMGSSLARGARELSTLGSDCDGVLVSVGDLPGLRVEHVVPLLQAFETAPPGSICAPVCEGRRGHPVLFDRAYLPELEALSGEAGARVVIEGHPSALIEIDVASEAIFRDVDTPEALAAAREAGSS